MTSEKATLETPKYTNILDEASSINGGFDSIPIIDIGNMTNSDFRLRKDVAMKIRDACINVGFFYITNHGVDQSLIDSVVAQAKRFFDLPLENKMLIDISKSKNFKGYTPVLGENVNPENRGDLHEGFDMGWEDPQTGSTDWTGDMGGDNVWPSDIPGFREELLRYYYTIVHLGKTLFRLFALALELPEDFFNDKTKRPAAIMRLLHYPPQVGPVDDKDNVAALQVQNTDGQWVNAVPIPGTFVINIGDQLARWTNDVFKSTPHRAINRSGIRRYSIPLFFGTDYEVKLEPLPSCVSETRPPRYDIVTAGEYVKSRLEATYT
ncbi:hypothetical protein FRB99_002515 [Tulasnella sp. 403]|nr:hypothetical protein FRB99_002515 [Tulasnella sp. 403]